MKVVLRTTGSCLAVLIGFHLVHISDTARWVSQDALPYLVHASVQLLIEMSVFTSLGWWLQRRGLVLLGALWLTATVWWTLLHILDIHMVRLMDISLAHAAQSVFEEGWTNFFEILKASNVPVVLYGTLALLIIGITGLTVWGYKKALETEIKRDVAPSPGTGVWTGLACMSLLGAAALMDCTSADPTTIEGSQKLSRSLPWKRRMIELDIDNRFDYCPRQQAWNLSEHKVQSLTTTPLSLEHTPPLFLFIIESLRDDAVTSTTAPHLKAFGQRHFNSHASYSNANATPLSWMAILTGLQPNRWGSPAIVHMKGSPALHALKQAGYSIHLHSSSRLSYYQMDQKLFGANQELISSSYFSPPEIGLEAWERDSRVLANLADHILQKSCNGELHIVFLEATHFGYSWPEKETLFLPVSDASEGLLAFWGLTDMTKLKNRYLNSIHHLDQKLGDFFALLKERSLYEEAQIVITSDHGEEFFENGHLFHASALDDEQIHVPLYWKLKAPTAFSPNRNALMSHVDILPSILHSLTKQERLSTGMDGHSIFSNRHPQYTISWRYNFQAAPHEFVVHTPESLLRASLSDPLRASVSTHVVVDRACSHGSCVAPRTLLQDPTLQRVLDHFFSTGSFRENR